MTTTNFVAFGARVAVAFCFVICLMTAAHSTLANTSTSTNLDITVEPGTTTPATEQCPANAPAEAQRAGFTTMVMCQDFTQPVPNSAGTGVTAGWLDCIGGPRGMFTWHMYSSAGGVNCGPPDITQVTDNAGGGNLAMFFQYLPGYAQGSTGKIWLQTDDLSSKTPGQGDYFNFPQASLIEITYRDNINDYHTACDGNDSTAWFSWSHEGGSGADGVMEYDVMENWRAGTTCASQDSDAALHLWVGPGPFGNAVWSFTANPDAPAGFAMTGDFNNTGYIGAVNPSDNYHTYGLLTTTNGSTDLQSCGYIDHHLVRCIQAPGISSLCVNSYSSQSGCWGQRDILVWWVGSNNGNNLNFPVQAWVKSWRVWSCAAWNAGSAKITTVGANTCYGTVISGP